MVVAGFTGFNLAEAGGFGGQMPGLGAHDHLCPSSTACLREEGPFLTRYCRDTPRLTFIHEYPRILPWPFSGGLLFVWVLLVGFPHLTLLLYFQNRVHVVFIACSKSIYDLHRREVMATSELIDHNV